MAESIPSICTCLTSGQDIEVVSAYLSGIPKGDSIASDGEITEQMVCRAIKSSTFQDISGVDPDKSCQWVRKTRRL